MEVVITGPSDFRAVGEKNAEIKALRDRHSETGSVLSRDDQAGELPAVEQITAPDLVAEITSLKKTYKVFFGNDSLAGRLRSVVIGKVFIFIVIGIDEFPLSDLIPEFVFICFIYLCRCELDLL